MMRSPLYLQDVAAVSSHNLPWQMLQGKAVLITGASGFLGSFLVDVLMTRNLEYDEKMRFCTLARNKNRT